MKKTTGILWITTLVFAFIAGHFTKPTSITEIEPATEQKQRSVQDIVKPVVANKSLTKTVNPDSPKTKRSLVGEKTILTQLSNLLGDNEYSFDLKSIASAYALVTELSEIEVAAALNGLNSQNVQGRLMMPLLILSSRYAELNPVGAVEFVSSLKKKQTKRTVMSAIISTWSKTDPSAAYDWVREQSVSNNNPNDVKAENYLSSIFAGLARQDLDDSLSKLAELSDDPEASRIAGTGIANGLSKTEDFIEFYQKAKELKLTNPMNSVMRRWTNNNPEEAAGWLETLEEGESKAKMQDTVLATWLTQEPKRAADWAMRVSSEDNRQSNAEKVVRTWVRQSPEEALNWVNQQSSIDVETPIKILLRSSVYSDVDFSIDNLNLLRNEDNRKEASSLIYAKLKRQNPRKAETFLSASPYKQFLIEGHL